MWLGLLLVGSVWYPIRTLFEKIREKARRFRDVNLGSYSLLDRAVHQLVLGSRAVQRASFDLERGLRARSLRRFKGAPRFLSPAWRAAEQPCCFGLCTEPASSNP
jgi:hypothetical protein